MARSARLHGLGNGTGGALQYLHIGKEKRATRLFKSLGTYFHYSFDLRQRQFKLYANTILKFNTSKDREATSTVAPEDTLR